MSQGFLASSQHQRCGFIPAWGNAPGLRPSSSSRANGPVHSGDDPVRHKTFGVGDGSGLQPRFVLPSIPGALPQAGIRSHLWCWGTPATRNLEQTIAGPIFSRWERTEVRIHHTAMNMAEILEA